MVDQTTGRPRGATSEPSSVPIPLHWETKGSGPPVLLLHGFAANGFTWSRWIPSLSEDHEVVVVEMKGFGDSPKPRDDRYSPLDQAALLHRLILQRDLRDLTLVGHSLGGGVALLTALLLRREEPERLKRLVIVAGAAYPQPIPRFIGLAGRPWLGRMIIRLIPPRYLIRKALETAYLHPEQVAASYVEAYSHPLRSSDGRYALSQAASQILPPDLDSITAQYPELDVPTLLIWGREDTVVPLHFGKLLAQDIPGARLEVLPECGHIPQEEEPAKSLAILQAFLAETHG